MVQLMTQKYWKCSNFSDNIVKTWESSKLDLIIGLGLELVHLIEGFGNTLNQTLGVFLRLPATTGVQRDVQDW